MNNLADQFYNMASYYQANAGLLLLIVGSMWVMYFLNLMLGRRLYIFGLLPRHPFGLIGIFTSPFLHGHFNHLFFNSIPMFILGGLVMLGGHHVFVIVSLTIMILSGLAVWLFGRKALHIGASGIIMGYFGYLIVEAIYNPSASAIVVAGVCFYYFGGLLSDLVPKEKEVSWEAHVFGMAAGIAAVYLTPYVIAQGIVPVNII